MMHRLVLVIAALLAGHAVAQAPSTPRAIDADLIVALLGTANAIAVEVPATAQHLYVVAVLGGEAVLSTDTPLTDRRDGALTTTIAAGALTNANHCPVLLFVGTGLEDADGQRFASSQRALCLTESEGPIGRRPVPSPLQSLPAPRELPLDTWLALEAVRFTSDSAAGDDLSGAIVFYLHLSTDASRPPGAPAFTTVQELVREQIGRGTN